MKPTRLSANASKVIQPICETFDGPTTGYMIYCPGCEEHHSFDLSRWTFDGNMEHPTFSPSLLVAKSDPEHRCHSFVRNGQIEFLSDCFHKLAGQTVPLPELED